MLSRAHLDAATSPLGLFAGLVPSNAVFAFLRQGGVLGGSWMAGSEPAIHILWLPGKA